MDKDNEEFKPNPQINTTNVFLLAILVCLLFLCYYIPHTSKENSNNIGNLQHYDSLYSERQEHISINQKGNVTGYYAPDGTFYYFETPIPTEIFYND